MDKKEYIEKEAAIALFSEKIYAACGNAMANGLMYGRRLIDTIPPADVKPVVKGEWLDYADKWDMRRKRHDYRCPKCGNRADYFVCGTEEWWCAYEPNYCPNCGADMRKEKDDEQ